MERKTFTLRQKDLDILHAIAIDFNCSNPETGEINDSKALRKALKFYRIVKKIVQEERDAVLVKAENLTSEEIAFWEKI